MTFEGQDLETNSDATLESSSETPSNEGQETAALDGAAKTEAANIPFHEHPRFKELVEQKNQYQESFKSLEAKYAQMEAQIKASQQQAKPATQDELIEDLRKVDPRLAARFEQMSKVFSTVETLQQRLEASESHNTRQQAVQQVNAMHDQNKVSPEMRDMINNQLDLMAMRGELKSLDAVGSAYKQVYDGFNKFIDGIKRAEKASYVDGKKADAKLPVSQPKGKPANPAQKKQEYSKDPEVARQQIVSRYLKTASAEKDI